MSVDPFIEEILKIDTLSKEQKSNIGMALTQARVS